MLPPSQNEGLSVAEIHQLAEAIHPRYRATVYAQGFAGLRVGEAAALTLERTTMRNDRAGHSLDRPATYIVPRSSPEPAASQQRGMALTSRVRCSAKERRFQNAVGARYRSRVE